MVRKVNVKLIPGNNAAARAYVIFYDTGLLDSMWSYLDRDFPFAYQKEGTLPPVATMVSDINYVHSSVIPYDTTAVLTGLRVS